MGQSVDANGYRLDFRTICGSPSPNGMMPPPGGHARRRACSWQAGKRAGPPPAACTNVCRPGLADQMSPCAALTPLRLSGCSVYLQSWTPQRRHPAWRGSTLWMTTSRAAAPRWQMPVLWSGEPPVCAAALYCSACIRRVGARRRHSSCRLQNWRALPACLCLPVLQDGQL